MTHLVNAAARSLATGMMLLFMAALLGGCTSVPPQGGLTREAPLQSTFEQTQVAMARSQAAQGHLAEAALHWEVLNVLRPNEPSYAQQLAQIRSQIEREASARLQAAKAARQRGAHDEAMSQYLAALALQPGNDAAAEALHNIERERIKRDHLGRLTRLTLSNRAPKDGLQTATPMAPAMPAQRNDLEHASLLAGQGEFEDAITLLNQRLKSRPQDGATRELLADVYYSQAQALAPRNKEEAVVALRRCLQLLPRHAPARHLLAQLTSKP